MIKDLAQAEGRIAATADVCIIGAGVAGLLLAAKLAAGGFRVAVLESGSRHSSDGVHALNAVRHLGSPYRGATEGRCRGLGGTSTKWGGQLVPVNRNALAARDGFPSWPLAWSELERFLPEIEALFQVDRGPYDATFIRGRTAAKFLPTDDADIVPSYSKVPDFKRRNLANLFADDIDANAGLDVWLNATVVDFNVGPEAGRLKSAIARNVEGRTLEIEARMFVVAAGAIESTRLLLALDAAQEGRIFTGCEALGRYFHDHISVPLAEVDPKQRNLLNRSFAPHFVGSTMRSTRLELTASAQASEQVGSAYAHISPQISDSSGFQLLKEFLVARQKATMNVGALMKLIAEAPYMARVADWRFRHHQLYWPPEARLHLHVVAEQRPDARNRITLTGELDALGARVPAIDWRWHESEAQTLRAYRRRFDAFWRRAGLDRLAGLTWAPDIGGPLGANLELADIYHPAGSTRMGCDPRDAVLDKDLQVFAVPNLWVASTSAFPSMGSANPTLGLMLMALRLAEHLQARNGQSSR